MMPLTMAPIGKTNKVKKVGGKDEVKNFLAGLGFVEGSEVTVMCEMSGNLIVCIKDTRVAIDREMANKIMI